MNAMNARNARNATNATNATKGPTVMTADTIAPGGGETAGDPGPARDSRSFPCDSCGAPLSFSIGAQRLRCGQCGFEKALGFAAPLSSGEAEHDLAQGLSLQAARRAQRAPAQAARQELACKACGAIAVFEGSLTATRCSYCDSPLQLSDAYSGQHPIPVDGLCTFQVEDAEAKARVRQWVRGRWFAPGAWKKRGVEGRFDGVYMPFFTYDAMTVTRYSGERGEAYWVEVGSGQNKRQERRVRWSPASGTFQRFFDDVCIPALQSLPQPLLQGLEPWPTGQVIAFSEDALAGKRAHTYEKPLDECFGLAKARIEQALRAEVRGRIGGDEQRLHAVESQFSALTYRHVLLPVWMLAYRYRDKPYRVVVNAVTGQVHGERPWSVPKIVALVLVLAVVVLASLFSD